jgi:hypothetical protein
MTKKIATSHILVALLLASPSLLRAAPPDVASVSGLWKITGDVHGRPIDMTCQLTENERRLSGTCTRSADGAAPHQIDGTVKGDKLQFQLQTALGSRPITLIVNGKLNSDDSRVSGELQVEPLGVAGKFHGEREPQENAAAAVSAAPPTSANTQPTTSPAVEPATPTAPANSSAQNATGTWKVDADFEGTSAELTCVLKQDRTVLTGTCTGEDGKTNPVKGEVNERGFTWHFDAEYQDQPISVTMTGKLLADGSMQGDASVAPLGAEGTFTATRQQPTSGKATPTQPTSTQSSAPAPTAETPPAQ